MPPASAKLVYAFDHKHRRPPMEYKDLLGGKGANLAEMTSVLKLPVPPGFTISTDACRAYMHGGWPAGLNAEIAADVATLEHTMGRKLGDPADPLLVSVRSGAKFSMPGMMDTVLNLGLNDKSVKGLAAVTADERFAYDSYRRFIAMYGRIVLDVPGERFEHPLDAARAQAGATDDNEIPAAALKELCADYKAVVKEATGKAFPQDPIKQLRGAVEAVFSSWNGARAIAYRVRERISHDLGTAVNVQAMVFGNRDDNSGTGVGFTRNAATGENRPYGDFLINAQGEDVVAGIRNTEDLDAMKRAFPAIHTDLLAIFARLERHYQDMCDTEFTIEQGKLWMLQTRVGKRTGGAALRMAVDMTKGSGKGAERWKISREEALQRVTAEHLDSVLHPQFSGVGDVIARGLAASPGAAVGRVYFTANDAEAAAHAGEKVILVRSETSPEDVHGMMVAEGILTSRGGLVSHAAVVARGWGTPAVVGAESVKISGKSFTSNGVTVNEGDFISLDGSSGEVVVGQMAMAAPEPPKEFDIILSWADAVRSKGKRPLGVRANADTGEDAAKARELGAEGIGLCRTEHMFLAPDRLPVVRRMILANTPDEEDAALAELLEVQRADFTEVLEAMDGLPVTIRLLDPPLHEFLPSVEELRIKEATTGLDVEEKSLLAAAESWSEHNPMIGTRGVRLGVIKPKLYGMQVRALMEAAANLRKAGKDPIVEVMIPLTVTREELHLARSWVQEEIDRAAKLVKGKNKGIDVTIGTMIETPRAAIRADEIAEEADFFSFGTNDLTQMAFGFSRDDVESRMMPAYLEQGLLKRNPFETIDQDGVGELVRIGTRLGRQTKPNLKIGVCGEHGGDPESIALFYDAGLNYVSCSPFRVPIARLAAAQAIVGAATSTAYGQPSARTGAEGHGLALTLEDIERLRSTVSIVDIVGQHVQLRRSGRTWKGLCPFHAEKTPSFHVMEETGRYKCYGCDKGGDVFTFVQEREQLDFAGAVELLAAKAGIQLTYTSAGQSKERAQRKRLVEAMATAVDWYHQRLLNDPGARPAREYLKSRGLAGDVARQFKLGWAPDDWDALAKGAGIGPDLLRTTGLAFVNRRDRMQDALRARVLFPIFSDTGEAVAIGGRVLPGSTDPAKYKNSPETPIYAKSKTLYGLHWAKADIVAADQVVVCEGYTDVIGFHQVGVKRAVATCGTALTEDHVRLLKRYASRVVLAFDADAAGQGAAERFYAWEQQYKVQVSVARLPGGADPGQLAQQDPDALAAAVADAEPFLAFRLARVMGGRPARTPEDRVRLAERAMEVVNEHPDANVRKLYAGQVASEVGLPVGDLVRLAEQRTRRPTVNVTPARRTAVRENAEFVAIAVLAQDWESIAEWLVEELFADETHRRAFMALGAAEGNLHMAIEQADPDAREVLERAAVADLEVDATVEARNLIAAAVRRELRQSPRTGAPESVRDDAEARVRLEELADVMSAAPAAEWLLGWLHRRMEQRDRRGS